MKKLILSFVGLLALFLSVGCEQMNYATYQGSRTAWPAGNSFTDLVFDVPVYRGWPKKPYAVLGYIQFNNPRVDWNDGDIKQAARQARAAGGDAIILMSRASADEAIPTQIRKELGIVDSRTVALVIKWKPENKTAPEAAK